MFPLKGRGFIGLQLARVRHCLGTAEMGEEAAQQLGRRKPGSFPLKEESQELSSSKRWLCECQWPRYQQMVLKNMKCSPVALRAVELLRLCAPNGCWRAAPALGSFAILPSRAAEVQDLAPCSIVLQDLRTAMWVRQGSNAECWGRWTAVPNLCRSREPGHSGVLLLVVSTVSGHTQGMQPSLCAVLSCLFQNTQIAFTSVLAFTLHLCC